MSKGDRKIATIGNRKNLQERDACVANTFAKYSYVNFKRRDGSVARRLPLGKEQAHFVKQIVADAYNVSITIIKPSDDRVVAMLELQGRLSSSAEDSYFTVDGKFESISLHPCASSSFRLL